MRVEPRRAFAAPRREPRAASSVRSTAPRAAGCRTRAVTSWRGSVPDRDGGEDEVHSAEPVVDHEVALQNASGRASSPDPTRHGAADRGRLCQPPNASRRWIHIPPRRHHAAARVVAPDPAAKWIRVTPPSKHRRDPHWRHVAQPRRPTRSHQGRRVRTQRDARPTDQ